MLLVVTSVRRPRIPKPKIPKIKRPSISRSRKLAKNIPTLSAKKTNVKPRNAITNPMTKKKHHIKKNMERIKPNLPQIKKEIADSKTIQSKISNKIKDNLKKIRETNISISGLEHISTKSIEKIQEKRTKSITQLVSSVSELNVIIENITRLEAEYKRNLKK